MKKAIITGIYGQDGSYLAKYLLEKKIKVYGVYNKKNQNLLFLNIEKKIKLIKCDVSNFKKISLLIKKIKPDFIFNFAGISSISTSYKNPLQTDKINNSSVLNILEGIKNFSRKTKLFQASSSELFSEIKSKKINEKSSFNPNSPYAIAKLSAHHYCSLYRSTYKIYVVSGILFNHESPLRKEKFFTKKIIKSLVNYKYKKNQNKIQIGNIYSERDWGNAEDFVKVIYKSLTIKKPTDYIFCTGKKRSVKYFIDNVAKTLKIKLIWVKEKNKSIAINPNTKRIIIETNKNIFRKDDLYSFKGNNQKAKKILNWKPDKNINNLIKKMIKFELKNYEN